MRLRSVGGSPSRARESSLFDMAMRVRETRKDSVTRFEEEFSRYVGAKYAIAVNSATSGLMIVMMALLRKPGDKVITTPMTFSATSNAVLCGGGIPAFADINPSSLCIDQRTVSAKVDSKCMGVLVVDLYGFPAVTDSLKELCEEKGMFIVEDAAQALGSIRNGRSVGSLSEATVFSFFQSKQLAIGEGGMITTNDALLANKFKMIRSHGQDRQYHQIMLGYNFRMPEKLANDGLSGLHSIGSLIRKRVQISRIYREILDEVEGLVLPVHEMGVKNSYYKFPLVLKLPISKVRRISLVTAGATNAHIGRGYDVLVYQQPFYRKIQRLFWGASVVPYPNYSRWHCPSAEFAIHRIVELPTDSTVSEEKAVLIASALKNSMKNA